jgi:hypothetical protein
VIAAFGGPVVGAMLGPAVHVAVVVIVTQVPCFAGLDQLTAAPACHGAGLNSRPVVFAQCPVGGAVAAVGGAATAAPVDPPAVRAPTRSVVGDRAGWARPAVTAEAWAFHRVSWGR